MKDKKYANNIRNKDLYENISNNWSRYYSKNRHYLEGWEQNKSHKKKYEEPVKKKVKRSSSSGSVKKQKKKVKYLRLSILIDSHARISCFTIKYLSVTMSLINVEWLKKKCLLIKEYMLRSLNEWQQ